MIRSWPAHSGRVNALTFDPAAQCIASVGSDGCLCLWSGWDAAEKRTIATGVVNGSSEVKDRVHCAAAIPGSQTLVAAYWHGAPQLWHMGTGSEIRSLQTGRCHWVSLGASADGSCVCGLNHDGYLAVWRADSGRKVFERKLTLNTERLISCCTTAAALSARGDKLAVLVCGNEPSEAMVFDVRSERPLPVKLPEHCDAVAFGPFDGPRAFAVATYRQVWLYDSRSFERTGVLEGHSTGVSTIVYGPKGKLLLTADWDRHIMLWDLARAELIGQLTGHRDPIRCASFSSDGLTIVTGGLKGQLCLWDTRTAQLMMHLERLPNEISSVGISDDQKHIFALYGNFYSPAKGKPTTLVVYDVMAPQ